jgi:HlyD family secretion protein
LVAVLYVPPQEGKKVRAGLPVYLAPSTVKKEEYGYLRGTVRSVAEIPSSQEGMSKTLKNQQLVNQLAGHGAPFEVVVELERDAETPSGFRWTSSRGPSIDINTGTLTAAEVTVRQVRLISLLIPALQALFEA